MDFHLVAGLLVVDCRELTGSFRQIDNLGVRGGNGNHLSLEITIGDSGEERTAECRTV